MATKHQSRSIEAGKYSFVRAHVRGLYRKLQVHNVAEAVSRAVRERLV
jgi:DNA-binding CsgD family transcriptional regulator